MITLTVGQLATIVLSSLFLGALIFMVASLAVAKKDDK